MEDYYFITFIMACVGLVLCVYQAYGLYKYNKDKNALMIKVIIVVAMFGGLTYMINDSSEFDKKVAVNEIQDSNKDINFQLYKILSSNEGLKDNKKVKLTEDLEEEINKFNDLILQCKVVEKKLITASNLDFTPCTSLRFTFYPVENEVGISELKPSDFEALEQEYMLENSVSEGSYSLNAVNF